MKERFFIATEGPFYQAFKDFLARYNEAKRLARDRLREEAGATGFAGQRNGRITALMFDQEPDPKRWKEVDVRGDRGWAPKRNTKRGREIDDLMAELRLPNPSECLDVIGARNQMAAKGAVMRMAACGFSNDTALAKVPVGDSEQWDPPDVPGLQEVKESEFLAAQGR